jgi:hypothetical protein
MTTPIKGKVLFLDQSSNMGGFWAFMPDNSYNPFPSDTYLLHDGDVVTIWDANGVNIVWTGTINLQAVPLMTQAIAGHWIRNVQAGVDLKSWYTWFEGEFPATLVTTNQVYQYPDQF